MAWGSETDADFAFWAAMFYGLAVLATAASFLLLLILPSSFPLRQRHLTPFLWSMSFWHLLNAIFHTPWFQGSFPGLGSVPRGMPWLCPVAPLMMDVAFNVELVSILALASAYVATLNRATRSGRPVADVDWGVTTKWLVLLFVWLWSVASSLPWGLPRQPVPINGTSPTEWACRVASSQRFWYKPYSDWVSFTLAGVMTVVALVVAIVAAVKALRKTDAQVHKEAKGDVKLLLFMIIKFGLSWLPVWVKFLMSSIAPGSVDKSGKYYAAAMLGVKWLHEHLGLWNFVLIPLFMVTARRAYRRFFTCGCSRQEVPVKPLASPYYR